MVNRGYISEQQAQVWSRTLSLNSGGNAEPRTDNGTAEQQYPQSQYPQTQYSQQQNQPEQYPGQYQPEQYPGGQYPSQQSETPSGQQQPQGDARHASHCAPPRRALR